jgi:FHS family L-fucose permease-like MFS transporter
MQAAGTYDAYLHKEILRVVTPYLVIGALALAWAVMIGFTKFPAFLEAREHDAEVSGDWHDLLHQPHFLFAILAQFLYCGSQTGEWSYLIRYAKEYAHTTEKAAGVLLAGNMVVFLIGRFSSAALMRRFSPARMMRAYGITNGVLLLVGIVFPGWAGLVAIIATSFFLSLMFPTIFALGLKDIGANTNLAGSLIVMAIVGGAVLTPVMGGLAEFLHNTAWSYQVPLYGNLGIAAYAHYMTRYKRRAILQSTFDV